MYEAIIITKMLMQILKPKNAYGYKCKYKSLHPFPTVWNYKRMYYVESIAEHIKAPLSIHT